jgi:protein-tyrosine phosphatase
MAQVLSWRTAVPAEVARAAAEALRQGQLVAFPTETLPALAAAARHADAVARLRRAARTPPEEPLAVALRGPADLTAWVSRPSALARRLARRCWPGPVVLAFPLAEATAPDLGETVCPGGQLWLRSPGHVAFLQALRLVDEPVVTGEAATLDDADLIIDDGPPRSDRPPSVVRVEGDRWELLREGVVSTDAVRRVSAVLIVFVCTGNTCRSPLAEAMCKRLLADRLGCAVEDLPGRGFVVLSAGVAVMMSQPAAEEAVRLAAAEGVDLTEHLSQPLGEDLAAQADYLLAMTQSHLQMVTAMFPDLACQPRLLGAGGADIGDPLGGDREVYEACAREIKGGLEAFLADIPLK